VIEHLYPTPVYRSKVKDYQSLNYHIEKVMPKIEYFDMGELWGSSHFTTSDFKQRDNILKKFGLNKVIKEIENHVKLYCNELGCELPDYNLESWFTRYRKGNYADIHHHSPANISGCYYYKTNEKDGDFFFESPNPFLGTTPCFEMHTKWGERKQCTPQEGMIMLFPGWMKHGVNVNTTDHTRICLAFNIWFKD
tara:strand:+ start:396 stop:977 length:582 start_codon:yes stop_codon:yes gene_type:complete